MNAFDLIVTVALGSMLATVVISKDTALAEGVLGLTLLILFQYGVAWLSIRSPRFSKLVKSEPRLLLHKGKLLERALREERIKKEELLQAIRNQGVLSLDQVEAVVIETNGSFSIIKVAESKGLSTLASVKHTHEMNKAAE
ncbi:MAG TPA: DUF421 domain-containing protein [Thermodesulfobacteriota bacterium]|nr:DUF421 domain-containing protein [Thermodesulfobacteriota bacterium]